MLYQKSGSRFKLSQTEAGVEGALQLSLQMTTYLANAWLLTLLRSEYPNNAFTEDPLRFHDDDSPYFIQQLWFSFLLSLRSITLAQSNRRNTLYEYSDSSKKQWLYTLCSLLNTILVMMTVISVNISVVEWMQRNLLTGCICDWRPDDPRCETPEMRDIECSALAFAERTLISDAMIYFIVLVLVTVILTRSLSPAPSLHQQITSVQSRTFALAMFVQSIWIFISNSWTFISFVFVETWASHSPPPHMEFINTVASYNATGMSILNC